MLEINNVSKYFQKNAHILDSLNLRIDSNEFFCLLGPSGCGKSTLLRIISGLETEYSGQIKINGVDLKSYSIKDHPSRIVFQKLGLFPHMTVYENIAFGPKVQGVSEKKIKVDVGEMIKLIRLEGLEKRKIQDLSGGQMQRVALARALINKPDLILLDESLSALDPNLRKQMQYELKDIQRKSKTTFIMVTHDPNEAFILADRVAILNNGKIEQVGSPNEVYSLPSTLFAFQFLGESNVLEIADFERLSSNHLKVRVNGQVINIEKKIDSVVSFVMGVRPDKISFDSNGKNSNSIRIKAEYHGFNFMGSFYEYYFKIGAIDWKVWNSEFFSLNKEQSYELLLNSSDLHVF